MFLDFRLKICYLVALCLLCSNVTAYGQAIISSTDGTNTVYLGINAEGHLNLDAGNVAVNSGATGLSYSNDTTVLSPVDATSPGCLCEGWGVSALTSAGARSGYANVSSDGGANNLTVDSFSSTASTATSKVHLTDTAGLQIEQAYSVKVAGALFEDTVTITNGTGLGISDVRYVRVMDWDVPFTEFSDFVTIKGTATTTDLELSHDDGFESANPLAFTSEIMAGTTNVDFTDFGPTDHGAYFKFNFGSLDAGESKKFSIFYGAAPSEAAMLAALGSASIELYSLGQSNSNLTAGKPVSGEPITYAFGFAGVGGEIVIPPVPEPATAVVWSCLIGIAGVFSWRKGKRRSTVV